MSHPQRNGDNTWGFYEVRLSVRPGGTFQAERVVGPTTEDEAAIEGIRESKELPGPSSPGTFAAKELRAADATLQMALQDPRVSAVIRRQLQQRLRFWHGVLRTHLRGELIPYDMAKRLGWALEGTRWHLPMLSRKGMVLRWAVWGEAESIYLSIIFGAFARTLHLCDRCDKPFVTTLQAVRRRVCDDHQPPDGTIRFRLIGLSQVQLRSWTRLRARFNQRVHNRSMSPGERDRLLIESSADLKRARAGLMSFAEWETRWLLGTELRSGRRRKSKAVEHVAREAARTIKPTEAR